MSTETSILLPGATVDLFLKDKPTIEAAKKLEDDWRFARVNVRVQEGDVETAIQNYAEITSPEIIIIETDTTDPSFIERLGALSGHCGENTSAIVIGPVNDVNLYRSLTAMGVSDYLVYPVPYETLSEVIASSLIEKLGASGSRMVALIGAKGGVGVSSIAQAMADASANLLGQKTLILDACGAWSSLPVGIGFEPVASTQEAIKAVLSRDADSVKRMTQQIGEMLFVLATGLESMLDSHVASAQFEEILNNALSSYPVVIVDLSGATPDMKKTVLTRAHEIALVSTPMLSSLRAARSLMQEAKKLHGGQAKNIDLIVNMSGIAPGKEVPKADIKTAMDCDPVAVLPFDPKLMAAAENEGQKLSATKPGQDFVQLIMPVLQKVVGKDFVATEKQTDDGLLGGLLGKLKTKK